MSTLRVDNIKHNNATTDDNIKRWISCDRNLHCKINFAGGAPLSHRNKVIKFHAYCQSTSFTNIGGATDNTLDRFQLQTNDLDQAVATVSQDSSAPDGLQPKIQCTTAETLRKIMNTLDSYMMVKHLISQT